MSAGATWWAWRQDVPAPEKLLLLALADECKDDGVLMYVGQADLAAKVGAAVRTVRSNLARLAERELIRREPQFEGRQRIADRIDLAIPDDLASTAQIDRPQSSSTKPKKEEEDGSARQDSPVAVVDAPEEMKDDALALLKQKRKVDGHIVTEEEMARALAAIATFNRASGSEFGLGAHLRCVVMRIRERPSMDAAKHQRLVESAWRLKWWERSGRGGRRATPNVIYGNERVFEQVVQDAVDEAAGRPTDGPDQPKRFTRED